MSSVNLHRGSLAASLAISLACGIVLCATPVFAEPANIKDVKTDAAGSAVRDDVVGGAKADAAGGAMTDAAGSVKADTPANGEGAGQGTTTSITSREASVTPLDTADSEEDYYARYNKQQMALFQQHEAVQHFNASQHYMKKWDTELAELELRAAIMYMPSLKIAHRDYCLVALLRGKPLRALAEFMMVVGLGEPLPLTEQQQKELRTEASQAHYKKGLEEATSGKWDDAITELMWARTYLPNDLAIHRSLAFAYASKGDFKMAERYYQSTFSIDPTDAFARADFAYLLSQKGEKAQAVAEMAKAVKADPDSTALHVDLGWLAEAKGDLAKAEEEFRAALKRSPQYAALWIHLGQLLEKRNKIDDARIAYKTAVEKEPSNEEAKTALVRIGSPAPAVPPAAQKATDDPGKDTGAQTKI